MKRSILPLITVLLGINLVSSANSQTVRPPSAQPVVRLSSTGFAKLEGSPEATTLQEVWKLPSTSELRHRALDKLGLWLIERGIPGTNSDPEAGARELRPLLNDLLQERVELAIENTQIQPWTWTLAIQLPDSRAEVWKTHLGNLQKQAGREKNTPGTPFAFTQTASWFVVSNQQPAPAAGAASLASNPVVQRIIGNPGPGASNALLSLDLDLSSFDRELPGPFSGRPKHLSAKLRGSKTTLKTELTLEFTEPLGLSLEPWKVPVGIIRDSRNSLMSFTAVQGIRSWVSRNPFLKGLEINPAPNQFFTWGQTFAPFQIQAALPVANGVAQIESLETRRVPEWNKVLAHNSVGKLEQLPNEPGILWTALPILTPYLRAVKEPGQDYLLSGIFPVPPSTNPPPAELISQLTNRDNILYYDWEITQFRLAQIRSLIPLLSIVTTLPPLDNSAPANLWMEAIQSKLGNTVTELSLTSPATISMLRTSHIGLNGLELVALAYWLESPEFPRISWNPGFRPVSSELP
jgi:hypothetical protein